MEALVLVVSALVVLGGLDLVAWLKGADSTDGFDSCEWDKRRTWGV